jgi:hypothetical protein
MLALTREQRRYLIEGDVRGLEETNGLLGALLASSEALRERLPEPTGPADHRTLADLRELAVELQRESRVNYVLACRGAEFAQHTLALIHEATEGETTVTAGARRRDGLRLIDRPA